MNANARAVATVALPLRARRRTAGPTTGYCSRALTRATGRLPPQSGLRAYPSPPVRPVQRRPRLPARAVAQPDAYARRATGAGFVPGETAGARSAYPSRRIVEAFCGLDNSFDLSD